jgi:hypothetical protein
MIDRLEPLIGHWRLKTSLGEAEAMTTFEWALGGQFLLERTRIDIPQAPDSLCVIAFDAETDAFTQHYFDSRGVVRVYAMTLDAGVWTLTREAPDFTPLKFSQRYVGEFSADGTRIDGRWEKTEPGGSEYSVDFELSYVRA